MSANLFQKAGNWSNQCLIEISVKVDTEKLQKLLMKLKLFKKENWNWFFFQKLVLKLKLGSETMELKKLKLTLQFHKNETQNPVSTEKLEKNDTET